MTKINLGSGEFPKKGFTNIDSNADRHPDVVHDLNVFPYPLADHSCEHIEADHVFEHLDRPFLVMKECHRILKSGGILIIRVPHFSRGFSHAEHKSGFDVTFPYYFQSNFQGGYTGVPFRLKRMKLSWFAQPYLKRSVLNPVIFYILSGLGFILSAFANAAPFFASRVWCFWVGGFEEIEFVFECVKSDEQPNGHTTTEN